MRLRDIQFHLGMAVELIELSLGGVPGARNGVKLVNQVRTREGLEHLREVAPFTRPATRMLEHVAMSAPVVEAESGHEFVKEVQALLVQVHNLHEAIAPVLPKEDPLSISIRIPRPENLDDLESLLKELQIIFEKPAQRLFGGGTVTVDFQGFDVGSEWIDLVLKTVGAGDAATLLFRFTLALLNAASTFRFKKAEALVVEQSARESGAKADVVEKLAELQSMVVDGHRDSLAKQLVEAFARGDSAKEALAEAQAFIGIALQHWSALHERGATVRVARSAPRELRENFQEQESPLELEGFSQLLPLLAPKKDEGSD